MRERTDGTITIRPYEPADAARLYEAARESVAEVAPWLPWCHAGYTRAEAEAWVASRPAAWAEGEAYSFVVADAASGRFLGGCGLNTFHPVHRFANLGYWIRTSATGRGAATAATRLVARFGVEALDLVRIEVVVAVDNVSSLRVAEKAGAHREGLLRNRLVCDGRIDDAVMFSFVPEDFGGKGGLKA